MNRLLKEIEKLKKGALKKKVAGRIAEFEAIGRDEKKIFRELCFCILTANFDAGRAIKIQQEMCNGFFTLPKKRLAGKLRELGHRFPNTRAKYILDSRRHGYSLKKTVESFEEEKELREWLVKNVKGIGYKEASHFMRNTGFKNVAIIDFHIIDLLGKYGLIKKPKTLTKSKYLEIEKVLEGIAEKAKLNLAELDLYLWFMETGKVLK